VTASTISGSRYTIACLTGPNVSAEAMAAASTAFADAATLRGSRLDEVHVQMTGADVDVPAAASAADAILVAGLAWPDLGRLAAAGPTTLLVRTTYRGRAGTCGVRLHALDDAPAACLAVARAGSHAHPAAAGLVGEAGPGLFFPLQPLESEHGPGTLALLLAAELLLDDGLGYAAAADALAARTAFARGRPIGALDHAGSGSLAWNTRECSDVVLGLLPSARRSPKIAFGGSA